MEVGGTLVSWPFLWFMFFWGEGRRNHCFMIYKRLSKTRQNQRNQNEETERKQELTATWKRGLRARRPPNFMQQASKTSVSRDTSSKFYIRSFQNEHFVRDVLHFSFFEVVKSTASCVNLFLRSSKSMIFAKLPQNAARATTVDTPSGLHSAATAIHKYSIFAMSQNAAPAKRKRQQWHAWKKSRVCHAKQTKRYLHTYLAKRNRSTLRARFCEDIDLQHVFLITFKREHRPMVRLSDLRYAFGKKTAN